MKQSILLALMLAVFPVSISADTSLCKTTNIVVRTDDPTYAEMTCDAAETARDLFRQCNMPPLQDPLTIEIVSALKPGCVGVYHCGEGRIEVLEPPLMAARRSPEGAFGFLALKEYFQSVIVHELAHAALDDVPCPFETCIVAEEYLAYAMQALSLPADLRIKYSAISGLDRPVSRDELSVVILFMAPQVFARKAWAHFSQRADPCAFVGQIVNGTVLLDRERFDSSYPGTE